MSPTEIIQIAAGFIAVAAVVFVCVLHEESRTPSNGP